MRVAGKPAIVAAPEAIAELRAQVRSLLGLIDTAKPPPPSGVIPPGKPNAGPVWKPAAKWLIRSLDEEGDGFVYVTTPLDWAGDYSAMHPDDARALAMALLAASDWAEQGPPAPPRRYPVLTEEDQPVAGRTFICGSAR